MFIPEVYTVESVTAGHPDKVCDQISDAILDACLTQDPFSRVAVECFGSHGQLLIGGEITSKAKVDYAAIAQQVYQEIGYDEPLKVQTNIVTQSPDIAQGVDTGGAGDQGIMYGYATAATPTMLPRGLELAHRLAVGLAAIKKFGPDGKTQVTMDHDRVAEVVVSVQHPEQCSLELLRATVSRELIKPVIGDINQALVHINPAGAWHRGGFAADTGLTGRKIMVDSYGGLISHGGGAFSGKDATKVDRSGAYMCRLAAKSIVAAGLAKQCLVSVAYAIGQAEPVMLVGYDESGRDITAAIRPRFDFRPQAIIERLNLRHPIYRQTAAYGHFGRPEFGWEKVT